MRYLSGIKRSMTRLLPRPSPLLSQSERSRLLATLLGERAARDAGGDASRAVAFFCARPPAASMLSPAEARRAVTDYARDKAQWRGRVLDDARRLCEEGLPVYAVQTAPLRGGLDWAALPTGPNADRLYRLRPHRFGFLPRLALAGCLEADCLPALHATLAGWLRRVETAEGAEEAYFSNLVIIYRLLAVSWAVPFLAAKAEEGDVTAARICLQLFGILAADCRQLRPQPGWSAPNNHRLADSFAAWFLAACYPDLAAPGEEPSTLERAWLGELNRQFQEDGTNFEQSLHYHELGCEVVLAYLVIALRSGSPPPAAALARVATMLRFQAALSDRHGNGFALGDTTDDPLLPLDAGGSWARGAWRTLYRALFDPAFPPTPETAAGAERAHWLLEALRSVRLPLLSLAPEPPGQLAAFPLGGYVGFRKEADDDYLLFRTGPRPGAAVFPGHAMSDLLSVYWNSGGKAVLEPAGTYSYAADGPPAGCSPAAPRAHFRGPAAHNGPVLHEHDPLGRPQGRFRNYDSGARAVTGWRSLEDVLAWAEARLEEPGPLNGWRRGVLQVPGRYTVIYDRVPALPAGADLACHWQFAPECAVVLRSERQAVAALPGVSAYLCASRAVTAMDCARGRQAPAAGWVSRRYGKLQAAPQLICHVAPEGGAVAFIIGRCDSAGLPAVDVLATGDEGSVVALSQGGMSAVCVFGRFVGLLQDRALHLDFDGQALWLAFAGDSCGEVRTLGLRHFASSSLGLELTAAGPQREQAGFRCLVSTTGAGGLCGRWVAERAGAREGGGPA